MAMVAFPSMSLFFVIYLMGNLWSSHARMFIVGGHDGWTLHPLENYGHWAKRHRFQISDILFFKYKTSYDYVLLVSKDDFLKYNKDSPLQTFDDGASIFKFNISGPFFFISGHDQNCEMGQKLIIVVISPHHHNNMHRAPLRPSSSPSPSPTTHLSSPLVNPPSHYPSRSPSNIFPPPSHSSSPSSAAKIPSHPVVSSHFPYPSPKVNAPSHPLEPQPYSPSPSPLVKKPFHPIQPPSHSPSPLVATKSPTHAPSFEPSSQSPSSSPTAITPSYASTVEPPSQFSLVSPLAKTPTHTPASHSPSALPMTPKAQSPENNINASEPELQHDHLAPASQSYPMASPPQPWFKVAPRSRPSRPSRNGNGRRWSAGPEWNGCVSMAGNRVGERNGEKLVLGLIDVLFLNPSDPICISLRV